MRDIISPYTFIAAFPLVLSGRSGKFRLFHNSNFLATDITPRCTDGKELSPVIISPDLKKKNQIKFYFHSLQYYMSHLSSLWKNKMLQ